MKAITKFIDLNKSLAAITHQALNVLLPVSAFLLVSLDLFPLALALVLLSKWRVLAVKSRYWGINLRSNMVDVLLGISVVIFMDTTTLWPRLAWLGFYVVWVTLIKRLSGSYGMLTQAATAQALAVAAIFYQRQDTEIWFLTLGAWLIGYFCARHVISSLEEEHPAAVAHVWALFAAQVAWVSAHWQVWFWFIPQMAILLSVIFVSLALLHLLQKQEALTPILFRQISGSLGILLVAILIFSDWQDKTI